MAVPAFAATIPSQVAGLVQPAGYPGGPLGGSVASSAPGSSWEIYVYSYANFANLLAKIPDTMLQSFQFVIQLGDLGSGNVVLSQDDPWWTTTTLPDGQPAHEILDFECLWQFRQDGVPRFEFMGETITEQLVDQSEQRVVTVTGPGTIATLKWAECVPPGFPNIVLKLDGIQDSFSEVNGAGQGVLDTNIWNSVSPAADVFVTPVQGLFNYPGGAGYALSTLYPSGSVTLNASTGTTFLGASPYDATDTLVSAQVSPIGLNNATGSYNVANLDGSQLTQFYIQSNKNSSYYALIGLSATAFYCQMVGPEGTFTKVLKPYNPANHAYWMITEQAGSNGNSGTFYFWTSPDGQNWTKQWVRTHSWDATNCTFFFTAFYDVNNKVSAQLTNLNSNVTTPSYQGVIYLNTPIMGVWYDQWAKAQARGTIPFITTSLSSTADSFGNLWTDVNNVQTINGTDLYSLLQSCAATLNADYLMQPGFALQVGQPQSNTPGIGVDRHSQVVFREGRSIQSRQRTRMRSAIQNLIGAENQDGHEISATNGTSVNTWGQREGWYQTAAQVDPTSMAFAAAAAVAANSQEVHSETLQIPPGNNGDGRQVFVNFGCGDWVGLERPDFSAVDAVRVVGIAVQVDTNGVETNELTLLTYVQWLEQQLTYVQNRMGGAFVNTPGLTPVAPSKYGTGQVPTWFDPAASMLKLADVNQAIAPLQTAPMVYNPNTGLWQPAGSTDPVSGNVVPLSVSGAAGTVTIAPGSLEILTNGPVVAPDGGGAVANAGVGIYANSAGEFFYNGAPALGNQVASITYASGTDSSGNPYEAGVNAYVIISGVVYAVGLNQLGGPLSLPGLSIFDTVHPPTNAGGVFGESTDGATPAAAMILFSGAATVSDIPSYVEAASQTTSGKTSGEVFIHAGQVSLGASGSVVVNDSGSNGSTTFVVDVNDNFNYTDALDSNTYHTGHLENSASASQNITSSGGTFTTVTGTTFNVGAKSYRLTYDVFYTGNQAAGAPLFRVNNGGGSSVGFLRLRYRYTTYGTPDTTDSGTQTAINTSMTGPTLLNGSVQHLEIELFITMSAGGTLFMTASEGTASDSFVINSVFGRLEPRQ